jgi:hypothetical protein
MVLMLIILGVGISTLEESRMMVSRKAYYNNLVSVLQLPSEERTDDKLQPFNVSVEHVRKGIPILKRYRLSTYSQP